MKFRSTRGGAPPVTISEALKTGLAPDGGLYVPDSFPKPEPGPAIDPEDLPRFAAHVLEPFFEGDPLQPTLPALCAEAFSFPLPLVTPGRSPGGVLAHTAVLELFHGPTAAFKDLGARFLAGALAERERDRSGGESRPRIVLVATSGDTGGAVAAAFHGKPGIRVGILFPRGGVSARQEKQLTTWGGNVVACSVRGDFDDCQRLLKEALLDPSWRGEARLTTANSVNLCRLLPQILFYASASLRYRDRHGVDPGFVIPSGNVGNAVGALWARRMGFPIRDLVLAVNANRTVPDYLETGRWEPRPAVRTLANAMDVGAPSNMERVRDLYPGVESLRRDVRVVAADDDTIRRIIAEGPSRWGTIWDPHTATAVHARETLGDAHWIVVATAHPAKFETVVEPLVGSAVEVPPSLERILSRPSRALEIEPELEPFRNAMASGD